MSYTASIEGFENQNIEVAVSFWSGPKLLVNGEPAQKGSKRGEMILQRADGKQVSVSWKQQVLGLDVPQLIVDGKTTNLVEPLKWYQLVWGGLPILLVFVGGAIGAVVGLIGFSINTKIFRTKINGALKYLASGAVSVLSVIAYFIAALILSMLIGR
jgi:hypothetical protein